MMSASNAPLAVDWVTVNRLADDGHHMLGAIGGGRNGQAPMLGVRGASGVKDRNTVVTPALLRPTVASSSSTTGETTASQKALGGAALPEEWQRTKSVRVRVRTEGFFNATIRRVEPAER